MHALLKYLQTLQPFVDMKSDEKTRIALGSNGTQRTILYRSLHADEFSRFVRQIPATERVAE